jgi:hypothetical protein
MKDGQPTLSTHNGNVKLVASNSLAARVVVREATGRPFLFRQLAAALDEHEARLRANQHQTNGFHDSGAASSIKSISRPRLDRSTWAPPAGDVLKAFVDMTTKRLKINITGLRPLKGSDHSRDLNDPANSTRKRRKVIDARCRIELAIYEIKNSKESGKTFSTVGEEPCIKHVLEDANLKGRRHEDGKFHFDIELVSPFSVNLGQLEVPVRRGGNENMEVANRYKITIKLRVLRVDDAHEILEHIRGAVAPATGQIMMEHLVATWNSLPKCPSKLIKASQVVRGKKTHTDYGFAVDMAWGYEHGAKISDSHLANYNNARRNQAAATLPTPLSTPTPTMSQTQETPKFPMQLEYVFKGHEITVSGLRCILCRSHEFSSLTRLRHHFETTHCNHHEVFKVVDHGGLKVEVIVESEARGRGSRKRRPVVPDLWSAEHEETWLAPKKPCDLDKLVEGDFSWEESGLVSRKTYRRNENVLKPTIAPKAPHQVMKALPIRKKKAFRVPNYPPDNDHGPRRYFSSSTHRVLEPGEELSESDDDIAMEWHLEAINNLIDAEEDLTEKLKAFYKCIETHFQKERTAADLFLGDSIIRWVHSKEAQSLLADKEEVQPAFEKWLDCVRKRISKEVYKYCFDVAGAAFDAKDQHSEAQRRSSRKNRGKRRSTTRDSEVMNSDEIEEPSPTAGTDFSSSDLVINSDVMTARTQKRRKPGECICGSAPDFNTQHVMCDNPVCSFLLKYNPCCHR